MKKVRYISIDGHNPVGAELTHGKIYNVNYYIPGLINGECVVIINDFGYIETFFITDNNGIVRFEDATHEYRNDIIDEILS